MNREEKLKQLSKLRDEMKIFPIRLLTLADNPKLCPK